jgi:hypothetical protein
MVLDTDIRKLLYESDDLLVIQQFYSSDTVFVTFNEMGMTKNGLNYWGADFFAKLNVSSIGIVTASPSWYPPGAMNAALPAILKAIDKRRVVTYGFSQGAYGALKYSAALRASVALAVSPQWSINPAEVGNFDVRYTKYFNINKRGGSKIVKEDLCPVNFILYDPNQKNDAENAAKIVEIDPGRSCPVIVPFGLHNTMNLIAEGGGGRPLIQALSSPDVPSAGRLRSIIRATRRSSKTYMSNRVNVLLSQTHKSVRRISACIEFLPDPKRRLALIALHAACGNKKLAEDELDLLSDLDIIREGLMSVWVNFNEVRFLEGELRIARLIRVNSKYEAGQLLHAVNTFLRAKLMIEAKDTLEEAIKLPGIFQHLTSAIIFATELEAFTTADELWLKLLSDANTSDEEKFRFGYNFFERTKRTNPKLTNAKVLKILERLSGGDPVKLATVAKSYLFIRECEYASILFARLERAGALSEDDNLCYIEADIALRQKTALPRLEKMALLQSVSPSFWERVSDLFSNISDIERTNYRRAIDAAKKAAFLGADPAAIKFKLAKLYMKDGNKRAAAKELYQMIGLETVPLYLQREAADLAKDLKEYDLACKWAVRQHDPAKPTAESIMYLLKISVLMNDVSSAANLIVQQLGVSSSNSDLSRLDWIELTQCAFRIGRDDLGHQATTYALKKFFGDPELMQLQTESVVRLRLFGSGVASAMNKQPEVAKRRWSWKKG